MENYTKKYVCKLRQIWTQNVYVLTNTKLF